MKCIFAILPRVVVASRGSQEFFDAVHGYWPLLDKRFHIHVFQLPEAFFLWRNPDRRRYGSGYGGSLSPFYRVRIFELPQVPAKRTIRHCYAAFVRQCFVDIEIVKSFIKHRHDFFRIGDKFDFCRVSRYLPFVRVHSRLFPRRRGRDAAFQQIAPCFYPKLDTRIERFAPVYFSPDIPQVPVGILQEVSDL